MKKGILSAVLMGWCSVSALHAHEVDEFVSDEQLNTKTLPNCPPTLTHPKDFVRYTHATEEEKKKIRLYYPSEILEIKPGEQPPYKAFKDPEAHQEELQHLFMRFMALMDDEDTCDQEGIKYVARLYHYFCPDSEPFTTLSPEAQEGLKKVYFKFPGPVFDLARQASNCSYFEGLTAGKETK